LPRSDVPRSDVSLPQGLAPRPGPKAWLSSPRAELSSTCPRSPRPSSATARRGPVSRGPIRRSPVRPRL